MELVKGGYQLVPPNIHQHSAAERAIKTFKNYLVSKLAGFKKNPLHLWYRILDQFCLTFNLLCPYQLFPNLSAHSVLHSIHNFNNNTLAPPGKMIIIDEKSGNIIIWGLQGINGWYLGPNPYYCRC